MRARVLVSSPNATAWPRISGLVILLSFVIQDRKSTRLNSSHLVISYAVFCLKKKEHDNVRHDHPATHHPLHRMVINPLSSTTPPSHHLHRCTPEPSHRTVLSTHCRAHPTPIA